MATWQLLSDAGEAFRWERREEALVAPEASQRECLPSMADVLVQGSSRLSFQVKSNFPSSVRVNRSRASGNEIEGVDSIGTPMFRTGSGKSVGLKQSSIARASAILGDNGGLYEEKAPSFLLNNQAGIREQKAPYSLLKNQAGICEEKAPYSLLNNQTGICEEKAPYSLLNYQTGVDSIGTPMFRTGSGKSVGLKQSSIARASAILGDDGGLYEEKAPSLLLKNQAGICEQKAPNSLLSNQAGIYEEKAPYSSLNNQAGIYEEKASCSLLNNQAGLYERKGPYLGLNNQAGIYEANSLFQTASGKKVRLSSEGLQRAKSLLGSEEDHGDQFRLGSTESSPPIKFQTAGGRSISISTDALQRARTLLEVQDSEMEADQVVSPFKFPGKENTPLSCQSKLPTPPSLSKNFTSPLKSYSSQQQVPARRHNIGKGHNLINKFDAEATNMKSNVPLDSRSNSSEKPPRVPLADISNGASVGFKSMPWSSGEKRRIGRSTVSPFKRPRTSKFVTPLAKDCSALTAKETTCSALTTKGRVSTRYPFQTARLNIEEYMGGPPLFISKAENLPDQIKKMNPDVAEKYTFSNVFGSGCVGVESFYYMLIQSGASQQYVSKEWVTNHYKWIVWKLASYERSYPAKLCGKLLSVSNVLEELKYRYEKEVNHGHRSSVKRILEGDSPPSTRIVLCISSILPKSESNAYSDSKEPASGAVTKIELTDGWYSINALLDALLSRKLAAGKLFVGQKLTISGAALCGWAGPVSPLEASNTASLLLHMNGTYRAHWADRLGFCKATGLPLAFRSIKCDGGVVPSTLIGILRIYPLLYRERLSDGSGIVRSERMQAKLSQLRYQRRSAVVEGVVSEFQKENRGFETVDNCCEGAKLLMMLENAAEPEMLMAEMTSEQLTSLSSYQAKLEATRQSKMKINVESALEAAGLSDGDFTPLMRVRVIGLTSKSSPKKDNQQIGLITIWNPTEKQQLELVEGQVYAVSWLMPSKSDPSTLQLQTKGSNTNWLPLSPVATESFLPFFNPRRPILLRDMDEVSFSSEFDMAAYVVYVGDVYNAAQRKKQWVFVADSSLHDESLLAINFCVPSSNSEAFEPVKSNLAGCTVGFCNLIKREKDETNNVWIAEAAESSTYSLRYDQAYFSHLKGAAASAQKWANTSSVKIQNLERRVSSIISNTMNKP